MDFYCLYCTAWFTYFCSFFFTFSYFYQSYKTFYFCMGKWKINFSIELYIIWAVLSVVLIKTQVKLQEPWRRIFSHNFLCFLSSSFDFFSTLIVHIFRLVRYKVIPRFELFYFSLLYLSTFAIYDRNKSCALS